MVVSSRPIRTIVAWLFAGSLSLTAYSAPAKTLDLPRPTDYAQAQVLLAKMFDTLEDIRVEFRPERYDPAQLASSLGNDRDLIFGYVRDEIAFQAYAGLLRGPEGTLAGRAGNSLDKANVLAAVLQAAGLKTRFAHGQLDDATARRLLAAVAVPDSKATGPGAADIASRLFTALSGQQAGPSDAIQGALAQDVEKLLGEVKAADEWLDQVLPDSSAPTDASVDALSEVADHYWIEVQDGPNWVALDPSLHELQVGDALATADTTFDRIDPSLKHRLRVKVSISRYDMATEPPARAADAAILDEEINSADTFGHLVQLDNLPDASIYGRDHYTPERIAKADAFMPTLTIGGEKRLGRVFKLDGTTADGFPDRSATGDAFGGAGDVLNDLFGEAEPAPTPQSTSALTGYWIDFTFAGPGAEPRTERRYVLDPRDVVSWSPDGATIANITAPSNIDAARLQLLAARELMLLTGPVDEDFAALQTLDAMLAMEPMLGAQVAEGWGVELPGEPASRSERLPQLIGFAADRTRFISDHHGTLAAYPAQAGLLLSSLGVEPGAEGQPPTVKRLIDIVDNTTRVLGGDAVSRFGLARELGVFDTHAEAAVMAIPGSKSTGAAAQLSDARVSGIQFAAIEPGAEGLRRLAELNLPARTSIDIAADLGAGYSVLVPSTVDDAEQWSWWRVNAASGTTLGMQTGPAGQDGTETAEEDWILIDDIDAAEAAANLKEDLILRILIVGAAISCWVTNQDYQNLNVSGGGVDLIACVTAAVYAWPTMGYSAVTTGTLALIASIVVWLTP